MWAVFAARLKEEEFQFVADINLARKTEYDLKKNIGSVWDREFSDAASILNPVKPVYCFLTEPG